MFRGQGKNRRKSHRPGQVLNSNWKKHSRNLNRKKPRDNEEHLGKKESKGEKGSTQKEGEIFTEKTGGEKNSVIADKRPWKKPVNRRDVRRQGGGTVAKVKDIKRGKKGYVKRKRT